MRVMPPSLPEQLELDPGPGWRLCANPQCAAEYGPWPLSAFRKGTRGFCASCTAEGLALPVVPCARCHRKSTRLVCRRCQGRHMARVGNARRWGNRKRRARKHWTQTLSGRERLRQHYLNKHARGLP